MDSIAGTFFNREVKILHCAPNPQAGGEKGLILQTANGACKLLEIHSGGMDEPCLHLSSWIKYKPSWLC